MFDSYQQEKYSAEAGLAKKSSQGGSHRRVHSTAIPLRMGEQDQPNQVTLQGYNIHQSNRLTSSSSKKPKADTFSTPGPKQNPPSVQQSGGTTPLGPAEIELYVAKRLKSIMSLQSSLQTNLARFSGMIEKLQKDNTKKSLSSINHEMARVIQEIVSSPSISQKRIQDHFKKLQEIQYELQNRVETELSNKDTNFLFVTNESLSFARITMKICNEFGCQAISLKKKLNAFFGNSDGTKDHQDFRRLANTDSKPHSYRDQIAS